MDKDLRKGIRAIVSGGLYGADEDTIQQVLTAAADAHRSRGKIPSIDEVKYLEAYVKICEEAIDYLGVSAEPNEYFEKQLEQLNTKYSHVQNKKVSLPTTHNPEDDEWESSWESSDMSCW